MYRKHNSAVDPIGTVLRSTALCAPRGGGRVQFDVGALACLHPQKGRSLAAILGGCFVSCVAVRPAAC
jgi:hypothetical protein